MKIAVLKERRDGETRVAATPETVKKMAASGHVVTVEAGAGAGASIPDSQLAEAGATIAPDARSAAADADLVLKVRRPEDAELALFKPGAALVGLLAPYADKAEVEACARARVDAFAMEFVPRITRAQSMDALSSQSNLAGYRAVLEASAVYGQAFPMMMTAAGTVPPAKVFVMGAGVAGLQAIATAKRLGAVVSATDVRPAAKEQVASLAAKFIAVEDEEFKAAETTAGYAKPMSPEYQAKQAALVAAHIAKQDIVVTTALIPGRPAPKLVSAAMVASMQPGSVIVDLAVEAGGNVEGAVRGQAITTANGVTILGYENLPGRLAKASSALYAKNLLNLLPLLTGEGGVLSPKADDEIVKAMQLTKSGSVVHPSFLKEPA